MLKLPKCSIWYDGVEVCVQVQLICCIKHLNSAKKMTTSASMATEETGSHPVAVSSAAPHPSFHSLLSDNPFSLLLKPHSRNPSSPAAPAHSQLHWNLKPRLSEVLNGDCHLDQALVRDKHWSNFELLCTSKPRSKLHFSFGGKEGCPDFIIIDCPAGIHASFITAITPASEALLVTTPNINSLRDEQSGQWPVGMRRYPGHKDDGEPRTDMIKGEDILSVLDVQEMLGLPLLGDHPEDTEVIRSTIRGFPLVLNKPPMLAGLAFEQAAWSFVEQESMKAVRVEEEPKKRGFFSFLGG